MINISNCTSEDNPRWALMPRPPTVALAGRQDGRSARRDALALAVSAALYWLAYFLRRCGDRWFAVNDTEAHWWGWQITKALGGLGRRYRDTRFDTLAACARCEGAGGWADASCGPCLGLGRIALGEVS